MTRLTPLLLGLILAACGTGAPVPRNQAGPAPSVPAGAPTSYSAPAPTPAVRERAALAAGCRGEADRIILNQDRGQLMREDERDARVGTDASIYSRRVETDRLGRIFERDRIAEDCVQRTTTLPAR
jgi:hypothetical protein